MRNVQDGSRPVRYLCLILCALSALHGLGAASPCGDEEKPLEEGSTCRHYLGFLHHLSGASAPRRPQAKTWTVSSSRS